MAEAILAAILATVAALAGVVVAHVLESRRQEAAHDREDSRAVRELRRQKLEELALVAQRAVTSLNIAWMKVGGSDARSPEWKAAVEKWFGTGSDLFGVDIPRLQMLVAAYAPELSGEAESLDSSWEAFRSAIGRTMVAMSIGKDPPMESQSEAISRYEDCWRSCYAVHEGAAALIRKDLGLNREPENEA